MNYILQAYVIQDIGQRLTQEDSFYPPFIDPCHYDGTTRDWCFYDGTPHLDDRLFMVCDGMGGHDRGEIASRIVMQVMSKSLLQSSSIEGSFNDEMVRLAVDEALDALAAEDIEEEVMKMGTTMTMLKFHAHGATIAHIGDSRVYHFRPAQSGVPARTMFCTEDHTVVNDLVLHGQMTYAQARHSSKRHILSRAMMSCQERKPEVEINHITDIKAGDVFMLCSDGLLENMDDEALCRLMTDPNYSDAQLVQRLLHVCNDNQDNRTAIIVRVQDIINTDEKMASDASLTPGTILKSDNYTYHIERVLGHGAFGITYLVNTSVSMRGQLGTIHTGVKVALKEFCMEKEMKRVGSDLVPLSPDSKVQVYADKFRREAAKLAMLSHPNIVKVLEVFEANNTIYYAMEYLQGGSLNEYVNRRGALPEQEAIKYIRQIGSALLYMHTNKMLHLDVKPANLMLVENSDMLKIIDFGLAKRFAQNGNPESTSSLGAGTPGYAPLEQVDANAEHEFTPALDVYALGATYYKLLTGLTPSAAIDILNRGINATALVKKRVSQQSIDAIRAAMQPMLANRLSTVDDFLDMLPSVDDQTIFKEKKKYSYWRMMVFFVVAIVVGVLGIVHLFRDEKNDEAEELFLEAVRHMEFVEVEGGTFVMGCADADSLDADTDELPLRTVKLSSFYICKYEVTNALWRSVMGDGKMSKSKNDKYPVCNVSWDDVQRFIKVLNKLTHNNYRLPTEAEWEYAARGGNKSKGWTYSGADELDSTAWHGGNSGNRLHPVAKLRPNELGLYDMSGNVWEYCSDWYGDYVGNNITNPKGPKTGDFHVIRGGCYNSNPYDCRTTYRQDNSLQSASATIGFRLVRDIEE